MLRSTILIAFSLVVATPALAQDWQQSLGGLLGGNTNQQERERMHEAWQRGYQRGYDEAMRHTHHDDRGGPPPPDYNSDHRQ